MFLFFLLSKHKGVVITAFFLEAGIAANDTYHGMHEKGYQESRQET